MVPREKGFATGLVVMGFGLGALAMSKLFAPMLLHYFEYSPSLDLVAQQAILVKVFRWLGILFMHHYSRRIFDYQSSFSDQG